MGKIVGLVNRKGGVGKTSSCINLCSFLSEAGKTCLALDLDCGQCNFTKAFLTELFMNNSVDSDNHDMQLSDILNGNCQKIEDAVYPVYIKMNSRSHSMRSYISMIPSFPNNNAKALYSDLMILHDALEKIKSQYDFIVIDFPPASHYMDIENSAYNVVDLALACVDQIIIPCTPDDDAIEGLNAMQNSISYIRGTVNPGLTDVAVFMNRVSKQSTDQFFAEFMKKCGTNIGISVPDSGIVKTSRGIRRPLAWYYPSSAPAKAFKEIADFVMGIEPEQ